VSLKLMDKRSILRKGTKIQVKLITLVNYVHY